MNAWNNLRFYWRQHVLVVIGLCLACAVCIASLNLGKSAEQQLHSQINERMGQIHNGIVLNGRFVQDALTMRLREQLPSAASVLTLRSLVSAPNQQTRHPRVLIHGVDRQFAQFAPHNPDPLSGLKGLAINQRLAEHLNVEVGNELIVRIEKPSLMSKDAPLSPDDDDLVSLRLPIEQILDTASFGAFQLSSSPEPAMNVFIPLSLLQENVELPGSINQIFFTQEASLKDINIQLQEEWRLSHCGVNIEQLADGSELTSERIFIDRFIADAVPADTQAVLGYMVNAIAFEQSLTPYSIVAALDRELMQTLTGSQEELDEQSLVINDWLADDLQAGVGDQVAIRYYELQDNNELLEKSENFKVAAIVPIEGLAADRGLMPKFPGLAEKDDCREWDPGAQVNLNEIREKDEQYWDDFRGTPKAFLPLAAGKRLWSNRFGDATAYRSQLSASDLRSYVQGQLEPEDFGLQPIALMEHAQGAASRGARYVSSVFVGLHTFVIVAALLLVYLFYDIALQHRRREIGLLRAQGFQWNRIRSVFQREHMWLMLIMLIPSFILAFLYDRILLVQLSGHWSAAVADTQLAQVFAWSNYVIGAVIVFVIAWVLLRLLLRPLKIEPCQLLLRGELAHPAVRQVASPILPFTGMLLLIALGLLFLFFLPTAENDPMRYFACACMLMIAGLCGFAGLNRFILRAVGLRNSRTIMLRNMAMHGRRHVFLLSLFAMCVFLVIGSSAFHASASLSDMSRSGPSGGFSHFGQVSVPIDADLNTSNGRRSFGIDDEELAGSFVVQMRANNDEETSCLNLNQSDEPRIWGVNPQYLIEQKAFPFMQAAAHSVSPWTLLKEKRDGRIPVIGDVNAILWSMGKGLGSVFNYTDEFGVEHELEVVALLQDSLLQGALIMDERYFSELFPSISGYQYVMLDAHEDLAGSIVEELEQSLQRHGLVFESSVERLKRYAEVRNTYIKIFQAIGILGIALGSIGLAAIVFRHIIERRAHLAVMRAFGFPESLLLRQLFWEHMWIVLIGLLIGVLSGLLVILPMGSTSAALLKSLGPILIILFVAACSCAIAARVGMRGHIDQALRGD